MVEVVEGEGSMGDGGLGRWVLLGRSQNTVVDYRGHE